MDPLNPRGLCRLAFLVAAGTRFSREEQLDWFSRNVEEMERWMGEDRSRDTAVNRACLEQLREGRKRLMEQSDHSAVRAAEPSRCARSAAASMTDSPAPQRAQRDGSGAPTDNCSLFSRSILP